MADTKPTHATPPVEGDGVSYAGLGWFIVILTVTTLVCQIIVWGAFEFMAWRADRNDPARAAVAAPRAQPRIEDGRIVTGTDGAAQPTVLVTEPIPLANFRAREAESLATYGWIDEDAGLVRLPIDRAKDLLLERGLPTRAADTDTPQE